MSSLPTAPQWLQSHPPSTQPPPQSVHYPELSHPSSVQSDHPPTPKAAGAQTSRSALASSASNVTPSSTSDSCPSTSVHPEPPTPSHLVSTPGAKKSKWYVVLVGCRTGIFDNW